MVAVINCFYKMQTGTVAPAGQTGGAIRVVLDFFACLPVGRFLFASRQKKGKGIH